MALTREQRALRKAIDHCGGQSPLARKIGTSQPTLRYWLHGSKKVPAEWCEKIERATGGAVTKSDLRPDLFPAQKGKAA